MPRARRILALLGTAAAFTGGVASLRCAAEAVQSPPERAATPDHKLVHVNLSIEGVSEAEEDSRGALYGVGTHVCLHVQWRLEPGEDPDDYVAWFMLRDMQGDIVRLWSGPNHAAAILPQDVSRSAFTLMRLRELPDAVWAEFHREGLGSITLTASKMTQ